MKKVEIKIIQKSISLILDDFIKELVKLNEPTEIHLVTNHKWGVTRIKNKSGEFRESVKKSKRSSDNSMKKLEKILTLLRTGNHKLIDDYVDEKPKKEFKEISKKAKKEKWYAVKIGKLEKILTLLRTGNHKLIDDYVDEKPKKEFKEISKKAKKEKWYAVKIGNNNIQDMIYKTWEECKKATEGYNSVFKSFETKEEAEKYLETVDVEKVLEQKAYVLEMKNKDKSSKNINIKLSDEMYQELLKKSKESKIDIENLIKFAISNYIY